MAIETATTSGFGQTTTAADGTTEVNLGSVTCNQVVLQNRTGTTLTVRKGTTSAPAGTYFDLPDGWTLPVRALGDVGELWIRRKDTSTTQVTLQWYYEVS